MSNNIVTLFLLLCSHQVLLLFIHCSPMQTLSLEHYRGRSYCAKGTLFNADLWISLVWNNNIVARILPLFLLLFILYDSEDVWMPYGSLSSQPGASNVTQAALRLTTL